MRILANFLLMTINKGKKQIKNILDVLVIREEEDSSSATNGL
jgi:hypothetical protein